MESTLHLQFTTNFGSIATISVPSPDRNRSSFLQDVIQVMDYIISAGIFRTSRGHRLVAKRRAWISDVTIEELDINPDA